GGLGHRLKCAGLRFRRHLDRFAKRFRHRFRRRMYDDLGLLHRRRRSFRGVDDGFNAARIAVAGRAFRAWRQVLQISADEIQPFAAIYFIDATAAATAATAAAAIAAHAFFACFRRLGLLAFGARFDRFAVFALAAALAAAAATASP